jgi:hypothetical protein
MQPGTRIARFGTNAEIGGSAYAVLAYSIVAGG